MPTACPVFPNLAFTANHMELPTTRELELEVLVRERDAQVHELKDEIIVLRSYLAKQPGPSKTDPITLPPPLMSVLLPHIKGATVTPTSSTSTVNAALTQRARLLQEENDELYALLNASETGKLKDEVLGLRRLVTRLSNALQDSHNIVKSLQTEVDKSYEALLSTSRQVQTAPASQSRSRSPRTSYHQPEYSNGSQSKPPPTGPRAHKKPRLSEPANSPQPSGRAPHLPHKPQANHELPSRPEARHHTTDSRAKPMGAKMDVDRQGTPITHKDSRDRVRERDRNKDRERGPVADRGWKDGSGSGGGGRRNGGGRNHGRKNAGAPPPPVDNASRTLQERLGL